jgi:hypothetical protein
MTLPEGFSEFEFLQDLVRKWHNRAVREEFQDLGGEDWNPDINIGRGAVRHACTIKDNDTAEMVNMRMFLYYFLHRKAQDLQQPVYGLPTENYQASRRFKPQILLWFMEDISDVEPGYSPVDGRISFRLMNEDNDTLTQANINSLANKIHTAFASGNGFIWHKGKDMVSYTDKPRGYQLQLQCRNESEGRRVAEQVLDIQNHTPNWARMNVEVNAEPAESYPTLPPTLHILGKNYKAPRRRPIADVRFQYALLHIWGIQKPICLVDRTFTFSEALVKAA